ncbi:hypothetical protein R3Q06_36470, partial [Rhodococcus erythropolis]|uniref:hypothetical protein n=1 Tax=Rhodococcus erythropolis TaxID=1833 RepID=UPI00294A18BE
MNEGDDARRPRSARLWESDGAGGMVRWGGDACFAAGPAAPPTSPVEAAAWAHQVTVAASSVVPFSRYW